MFEHLPSLDILLALNSTGHGGTGIVMQQNDAVSEFAVMSSWTCVRLLKHLTVTFGIGCVITWFRVTELQYLLDRMVSEPQTPFLGVVVQMMVSLCVPWSHTWQWMYSSSLAIDGGEWSAWCLSRFPSGERAHSANWTEGYRTPHLVWMFWRIGKFLAMSGIKPPVSWLSSLLHSNFTCWDISPRHVLKKKLLLLLAQYTENICTQDWYWE
jgi:hypothetical protein